MAPFACSNSSTPDHCKRAEWLDQGGEFRAEYRIKRPDGEVRWVHERAYIGTGPATPAPRSTGTLQDVTDRRRQELRVRQFHLLVEGSEDLFGIVDDSAFYQWVNQAYARMYGIDPEDFMGRAAAELVGNAYFEKHIRPHYERCLAGESQRSQPSVNCLASARAGCWRGITR